MSTGSTAQDTPPSTPPALDHHSTARVSTGSPRRYGHQLVDHMGRRIQAEWDEATATGRLTFDRDGLVAGVVDLAGETGTLVLALSATAPELERLEEVVGSHLARFGRREGQAVAWQRQDGSAGTSQGPLSEEDMERIRRSYQERAVREASQTGATG